MARRLSVSTALFDGYPIETALAEIAAAGAALVEPAFIAGYVDFDETAFSDANAAALRARIAGAGLAPGAVSAHLDLGEPGAPEALASRVRFAAALGAPVLITNAGGLARRDTALRAIGSVVPLCAEAGVVLALENPGHGTGALIGRGREGVALVDAIGAPCVRLNYDVGNVFTYSREALDPADDIVEALPACAHLHAKDVRADPEGWSFTAIGDGSIDYRRVRERLDRLAPELPIGIELPLRLRRPARADPARAAAPLPLPALRTALARSLAFLTAPTLQA